MSSIDQQFIEYIIKSLVGNPDAVKVERRVDEKGVLLELIVDPEDLGRVIGKRGATAQSLRTLLRALGSKNDARYNLKIVDTGPPPERRDRPADDRASAEDSSSGDSSGSDDRASDKQPVDDKPSVKKSSGAKDDSFGSSLHGADEEGTKEETDHSDVISRTRAELADLDDLEV